jgi:sugar diacid utilization regulator
MRHPERARRLANAVTDAIRNNGLLYLVDVRDNLVVVVFTANHRTSGWTAPLIPLSRRVLPGLSLLGTAVLVGISGDVLATSLITQAYEQAVTALRIASVSERVVSIVNTSLHDLMVHAGADQLRGLLPSWSATFHSADDRSRGALSKTLRVYADASMNVLQASARLHVHPNTVYARLNKIAELTQLDAKSFRDLRELLIVCDLRR